MPQAQLLDMSEDDTTKAQALSFHGLGLAHLLPSPAARLRVGVLTNPHRPMNEPRDAPRSSAPTDEATKEACAPAPCPPQQIDAAATICLVNTPSKRELEKLGLLPNGFDADTASSSRASASPTRGANRRDARAEPFKSCPS